MTMQALYQDLEARYNLKPVRQVAYVPPPPPPVPRCVTRERWQPRLRHSKGGIYINMNVFESKAHCESKWGHRPEWIEAVLTDRYEVWDLP